MILERDESEQQPIRSQITYLAVFKTATLFYKFRHTGFSKYFASYLSSYSSSCSTRCSQRGGNFLVIPKFYRSIHKSVT